MKKQSFLLIFLCSSCSLTAQVKRSYFYNHTVVEILAQNNRIENNFSFPSMKAFIIIGDLGSSLDKIYAEDNLRKIPISGMKDYACFYYIKADNWLCDTTLKSFLQGFIHWCYEKDYLNRNSIHLVWQKSNDISCDVFKQLDALISSISILNDNPANSNAMTQCNQYLTSSTTEIWEKSQSAKTSIKYEVPGMLDMERIEGEKQQKRLLQSFYKKKGDVFLQFTVGNHHIGSSYRTAFDTITLVDFTKFKTLWNLKTGYYFSNRLYTNLDFAFIYSGKQKNINSISWGNGSGITVKGSGYAGAMIRYGLGLGFVAYNRNKLSINTGLEAGRIHTIAGGGNATRNIGGGGNNNTTIVEKKHQNIYYNIHAGAIYKFDKTFYFNGNLQYNISPFKQPLGSVSAFTGISINIGLGISIPTKKKNE